MDEPTLEDALAKARNGDEPSIAALYRSIQPQLLRFLAHKAPGLEEDIASEAWLTIAHRLPGFTGSVSDLRALIFTIARRRVIDHYRQKGRRPRLVPLEVSSEEPTQADVAETAIENLGTNEAIELLIAKLPPKQAEVLLLRIVADMSTEEIANIVGRTTGAVRVLQHRALSRLFKEFSTEM